MFELLTYLWGTPLFLPGGELGTYFYASRETLEGFVTETTTKGTYL